MLNARTARRESADPGPGNRGTGGVDQDNEDDAGVGAMGVSAGEAGAQALVVRSGEVMDELEEKEEMSWRGRVPSAVQRSLDGEAECRQSADRVLTECWCRRREPFDRQRPSIPAALRDW